MNLKNKNAEIYIPDGVALDKAFGRTDYLAITAHQDDIEIAAYQGISECFGKNDKWFTGVVVTNGAGSARDGIYAEFTDEEMQKIRIKEQKKAAFVGEYSAVVFLDYASQAIKDPKDTDLVKEIEQIIKKTRPKVIYTHNLADKHDTHVGVVIKTIKAIRNLPFSERPEKLYGCEVWRNLDWVNDDEKITFDVSSHPNIAAALVEVYDSQVIGGKRYDLATIGRRRANATYAASHAVDESEATSYAIDLTPLIVDDSINIGNYIDKFIENFRMDVKNRLKKLGV